MLKSFRLLSEIGQLENDITNTNYEFVRSGLVYTNAYGTVNFTKEQLDDMANNFNAGVAGMEIAVDVNHDPEKKAYAWIVPESLYVAPSRKVDGEFSLFGRLHKFTPEGEEHVRTGAYRYFSIEVHFNVKQYVNSKLKVFKNVLMGLALTNFPAIKGLSPTFSDVLHSNQNANMDTLKIFLSSLKKAGGTTSVQRTLLSEMVAALPEEDKEAVAVEVTEVEALPDFDSQEDDAVEDTKAEEKIEASEKLAHLNLKLSEENKKMSSQLKILMSERKNKMMSDAQSAVMLSNANPTGFTKESEKDVAAFMSTLDEAQLAMFGNLIGKVKTVQLGEAGATAQVTSTNDIHEKALALSETIAKEKGISKSDAILAAYEQLGYTGE